MSKTIMTALGLIVGTAVLTYFQIIPMSIAWLSFCLIVIEIPKRDTQRKIERASKHPIIERGIDKFYK